MAALAPLLLGSSREHPLAAAFAAEIHRVHRRYAEEVVARNRLCPFLRDVETGFGRFCVVLDAAPEVALALEAVAAAGTSVVHLVYPCTAFPPSPFEKFAGKLAEAPKKASPSPPVMAVFHPELSGSGDNAHRLVGLLRRAPDPFVQLIPEGLHEGGTVFGGVIDGVPSEAEAPRDPSQENFDKLRGEALGRLLTLQAEIRADRDRGYAPFFEAFGAKARG
jgi:hypothetical protein